jgi:hypothetical protein
MEACRVFDSESICDSLSQASRLGDKAGEGFVESVEELGAEGVNCISHLAGP